MSLRRHLPTVALCSATVLLSVAGGATAAGLITGEDIKNRTVTSADVADQTLTRRDISPAAEAALRGAQGSPGEPGPAGPAGITGATGPAGAAGAGLENFDFYQDVARDVPTNADGYIGEAACPTGQSIVGAWAFWNNDPSPLQVSVGFINENTMAAVAYSPGIDTVQDAIIQISCATLPQPAMAKRETLPSLR